MPFDPRPPAVSSGLRIGTPALATRGFEADDFREVGRVIGEALTGDFSDDKRAELSERTRALAERHPLYRSSQSPPRSEPRQRPGRRFTRQAPRALGFPAAPPVG